MNILVLGGTGAMGKPLVEALSDSNYVYVTSRKSHSSTNNIKYILGNALDSDFIMKTLSMQNWDAIVDFMVYSEEKFKEILPSFLSSTKQYVFISSARVYAQSDNLITEESHRLLDVCSDKEYLSTNEYALAKAKAEDILRCTGYSNYTIIRPSITYNINRLQLGVLEKEDWLYRVVNNRSIVFSEDIADKITAMTLGNDVSVGIKSIIGRQEALGETYHITYPRSLSWTNILNIYLTVLEEKGYKPRVFLTKKSTNLNFKNRKYQVIYCRYFNRTFDNSKIALFCDVETFTPPEIGLKECLEAFLEHPVFSNIDWKLQGINDRVAGEKTPLKEIDSFFDKMHYILYRYNLGKLDMIISSIYQTIKQVKSN